MQKHFTLLCVGLAGVLVALLPYVYKTLVDYTSGKSRAKEMAEQLFDDFWQWRLKDSPELATMVGMHEYDDQLESYSLQSYNQRKESVEAFLKRARDLLPKVQDDQCSSSLHILIDALEGFLRGLSTMGHLYPISFIEGVHIDFSQTMDYMVFKNTNDYRKLLSRYSKLPKQLEEVMELMKEGIRQQRTLHRVSMKNVLERLDALQVAPEESEFFQRFKEFPKNISDLDRKELAQDAKKVIATAVLPAFKKLRNFIKEEYMAHLRPETAASSLPEGNTYYQECLRYHLELPLTAKDIHAMGLQEVERILGDVKEVSNFSFLSRTLFHLLR